MERMAGKRCHFLAAGGILLIIASAFLEVSDFLLVAFAPGLVHHLMD